MLSIVFSAKQFIDSDDKLYTQCQNTLLIKKYRQQHNLRLLQNASNLPTGPDIKRHRIPYANTSYISSEADHPDYSPLVYRPRTLLLKPNPGADGKNPDGLTGGSNDPTRTTAQAIRNLHTNARPSVFSFFVLFVEKERRQLQLALFAETVGSECERRSCANSCYLLQEIERKLPEI